MVLIRFAFSLSAGLSAAAAIAQELPASPSSHSAPAAAPAPLYLSAFTNYISFREPELLSWRAANDQVRDAGTGMGGHDMSKMGHDMSKMNGGASGAMATPGHDMKAMKTEKPLTKAATSAPVHDMANMGKGSARKAVPATGKRSDAKPAPEPRQEMMDHSKMNKQ